MGATKLMTAAGGGITLDAASTATDKTITVPADNGTLVYANSSGNVGIGTSSPSGVSGYGYLTINGTNGGFIEQQVNGSAVSKIYTNSGDMNLWCTGASVAMRFHTQGTERMRIDSSGNLLVGTTSRISNERFIVQNSGSSEAAAFRSDNSSYATLIVRNDGGSGTRNLTQYRVGTTDVGWVSSNGTTAAYNTTSDYRLKENVQPMTGALARVAALKPCTYTWKADGSDSQGFIAHELQSVVPDCVTGEKDAVDADGNPVYQGIDTSFLVATLTAAIQELKAELDAAKADIAALKGTV